MNITVYLGSRFGRDAKYRQAADKPGRNTDVKGWLERAVSFMEKQE